MCHLVLSLGSGHDLVTCRGAYKLQKTVTTKTTYREGGRCVCVWGGCVCCVCLCLCVCFSVYKTEMDCVC